MAYQNIESFINVSKEKALTIVDDNKFIPYKIWGKIKIISTDESHIFNLETEEYRKPWGCSITD